MHPVVYIIIIIIIIIIITTDQLYEHFIVLMDTLNSKSCTKIHHKITVELVI
jgi:hypothetical protein